MPKQVQKGGLFSKLGNAGRGAHDNVSGAETTYDNFGDLPPGINNGIAKLVDCKFVQIAEGKQNAGEYMFYAAGVVVEPAEHEGVPVQGLRTQISEPLFATETRTRKTVADHLGWVYNELRKLGVDTANMNYDDLEETVAALKEAGPYFRFRTWQGEATEQYPNPRVNHNWNGTKGLENYTPPEEGDGVVDNTEPAAPPAKATAKPAPKAPAKAPAKKPVPAPEPEPAEATLKELAVIADDTDDLEAAEQAQEKLQKAAAAAGLSEEDVSNAESWDAVVEMITAAGGAGAEEDSGEADVYIPAEGDILSYTVRDAKGTVLTDPKTKKPRKPVQVSVVAVHEDKGCCDVKSMMDNKTVYKNVKFDHLDQIT